MSCAAGPDVSESGLVLALDGANYKSFKGESITNLYYADAGSSANNSIFHMPMGGTATGSYTTSHSYGSWSGNTIFKLTVSSGTLAGGYESFRSCVSSSLNSTYGTTRRLSAKVKMLKGSITSLGFHNGGATGGHNSSHYTPISESSVPTDVLSKDGWYQFDMDVSGSYPSGQCVGIGIVGSDIEFLVTEMMVYPSSSFVRFTPTTRGTTVATGGGWADLTGNGNNGELVNGVRESSDNLGALVFDGYDEFVNLGSFFNYQTFTIELWVNPGTTQTTNADIFDNNHTGTQNFVLQQNASDLNNYAFGVIDGSGTISSSGTIVLTANTWTHLAFTFSPSTRMITYINGAFHSQGNLAGGRTINYVSPNLSLGRWSYGNSRFWNGKMSSFKSYNRILTASEVQQNFNANRSRFGI